MRRFLSVDDSKRAFNTFRKLALHDVLGWALAGGLAAEFHCLRGRTGTGKPGQARYIPFFECMVHGSS